MGDDSPSPARVSPRELFPEPRFDPDEEEGKIRALWAGLKDFRKPGAEGGETGAILLEPVDLTGPIHMGDALGAVLADVSARARRMRGENVLLVTGIHHVGVSTPWALREWIPKTLEGEGEGVGDEEGGGGRGAGGVEGVEAVEGDDGSGGGGPVPGPGDHLRRRPLFLHP